jgi:hypothetical protein
MVACLHDYRVTWLLGCMVFMVVLLQSYMVFMVCMVAKVAWKQRWASQLKTDAVAFFKEITTQPKISTVATDN